MSGGPQPTGAGASILRVRGFRTKVLLAMMLVVTGVTALVLYVSQQNLADTIKGELQREFEAELAAMHQAQALRHAALVERCRALVRKPRIHAALEDNALDLLYPNAVDELRDVMSATTADTGGPTLRALFYRFLDRTGRVISPPAQMATGNLPEDVETALALPALADAQQLGYVVAPVGAGGRIAEVITTPILSSDTGEPIAALVLGFKPLEPVSGRSLRRGIWLKDRLYLSQATETVDGSVVTVLERLSSMADQGSRRVRVGDVPHQLFFKRLNPGSLYPPALEVSLYPLNQFAEREAQVRIRVIALGALLLAGAFVASHFASVRLARPVEKLAVDSERSARFSADASHQLKTPVTVLRAGLEELMTRDNLTPDEYQTIGGLIHQTYRLSSLIEDLLLLSRMDSGRLKMAMAPVDLAQLLAGAIDDLSAMPEGTELEIMTDLPEQLFIQGERRYTAMILQNLLENARKYNRPGGWIRISAQTDRERVRLSIANTGAPMSAAAKEHVFERFHRGAIGENVPGYGLGLNLARELARLHDGDLRLVRSDEQWTEFEVSFKVATSSSAPS